MTFGAGHFPPPAIGLPPTPGILSRLGESYKSSQPDLLTEEYDPNAPIRFVEVYDEDEDEDEGDDEDQEEAPHTPAYSGNAGRSSPVQSLPHRQESTSEGRLASYFKRENNVITEVSHQLADVAKWLWSVRPNSKVSFAAGAAVVGLVIPLEWQRKLRSFASEPWKEPPPSKRERDSDSSGEKKSGSADTSSTKRTRNSTESGVGRAGGGMRNLRSSPGAAPEDSACTLTSLFIPF